MTSYLPKLSEIPHSFELIAERIHSEWRNGDAMDSGTQIERVKESLWEIEQRCEQRCSELRDKIAALEGDIAKRERIISYYAKKAGNNCPVAMVIRNFERDRKAESSCNKSKKQ